MGAGAIRPPFYFRAVTRAAYARNATATVDRSGRAAPSHGRPFIAGCGGINAARWRSRDRGPICSKNLVSVSSKLPTFSMPQSRLLGVQ